MAEGQIRSDEIVQQNLFSNTIESANQLLGVIGQLKTGFAETKAQADLILKNSGDPKSAEDIRQTTAAIKKSKDARLALIAVEKQEVKLKQEVEKLNQQTLKTEQQKVRLEEQKLRLKRSNSKETKKSVRSEKESLRLKKQLISQTVKEAKATSRFTQAKRRSNQTSREAAILDSEESSALERLNTQVNIAQREFKNLAISQGLTAKSTLAAQQRFEALDNKLAKVNMLARDGRRNVGRYGQSFDSLGFSVRQIGQELPAFAFGVNIGIAALSNNLPILFQEIQRTREEITALTKAGKKVPSLFSRLSKAVFNFQTLLILGVTALTVFGREIQAFIKTMGEADEALERNAESRKKNTANIITNVDRNAEALRKLRVLRGEMSEEDAQIQRDERTVQRARAATTKRFNEEIIKLALDLNKRGLMKIETEEDLKGFLARFTSNTGEIVKLSTDREALIQEELEKTRNDSSRLNSKQARAAAEKRADATLAKRVEINKLLLKIESGFNREILKLEEALANERLIKQLERVKGEKDAADKIKDINDNLAGLDPLNEDVKIKEAELIKITALEKKGLRDKEDLFNAEVRLARAKLRLLLSDSDASLADNRIATEEFNAFLINQELKLQKELDKIREDAAKKVNKKTADAQKRRLQDIKDNIRFGQQLTRALSQEADKRLKSQDEAREAELDKNEMAIDRQAGLAERGLDNQLAFEQKKRDELILQKRLAQEKEAKIQEAIQLSEAYLNAFNARLTQKDANPTQAAGQALGDVLFAKGIAKTLTQFFAEGTDFVQGGGSGVSDSVPAMLSRGEGVVTEVANRDNQGVVKSLNDGSFQNMFIPRMMYEEASGNMVASSMIIKQDPTIRQNEEIKGLLMDIKNKPVQQVDVDGIGNLIETVHKNGMKIVTKHKRPRF